MPLLQDLFNRCRTALYSVIIFSCVINLLMLVAPLYMLQIFDRVLASRSYETLLFLTLIAIVAIMVLGLVEIIRSRLLLRVGQWLDVKLSPEALLRSADQLLTGNNYPFFALRDVAVLRQFFSSNYLVVLLDAPWVPLFLIVIFIIHPLLGWLATSGAVILFLLAIGNEYVMRKPSLLAEEKMQQCNQKVQLALRNAETIQSMGMLKPIIYRWLDDYQQANVLQAQSNCNSGIIIGISKFFRISIQILMLGVGALLVINDVLTPGGMIAGTILLGRALAPVEQSIGAWSNMLKARQAYHQLHNYFERAELRPISLKLPQPHGLIKVENVSYQPFNSIKPILSKINFSAQPGEILLIMGPSAAGKTSLARLLVGAWKPNKGCIRLDGADVFTWGRDDFGKYVGYLPQSIELFPGTIAENISRLKDGDDKSIIEAAKKAGIHEMILHLDKAYETPLINGGENLSGGQRQRLALARALYGNPKLLVLDEPGSNLDQAGDEQLLKSLIEAKKQGVTVIIISHKINILGVADKILILNQGKIQVHGDKEQMLKAISKPGK